MRRVLGITLAAVLSGCATSTPTLSERTSPVPAVTPRFDIDAIVDRHRSELEALADLAKVDNIERGGVIIYDGRKTRLIELPNEFRDGPELIRQYAEGQYHHQVRLDDLITSAANARSNCELGSGPMYLNRAAEFRNMLVAVQMLSGRATDWEAFTLQMIFGQMALHTTYRRESKAYEDAKKQGQVLYHVHTHNDTREEIPPDSEDMLAPSRQDLMISLSQESIVTGVDFQGRHRIYFSTDGFYRLVERPVLAAAPRLY